MNHTKLGFGLLILIPCPSNAFCFPALSFYDFAKTYNCTCIRPNFDRAIKFMSAVSRPFCTN